MLTKLSAALLIVAMLCVIGCAAHVHKVGNGAQGTEFMAERQWYVLWGLVPVNDVDTHAMAAGATDYEIVTEYTLVDGVISIFTNVVTVQCRTVSVQK